MKIGKFCKRTKVTRFTFWTIFGLWFPFLWWQSLPCLHTKSLSLPLPSASPPTSHLPPSMLLNCVYSLIVAIIPCPWSNIWELSYLIYWLTSFMHSSFLPFFLSFMHSSFLPFFLSFMHSFVLVSFHSSFYLFMLSFFHLCINLFILSFLHLFVLASFHSSFHLFSLSSFHLCIHLFLYPFI